MTSVTLPDRKSSIFKEVVPTEFQNSTHTDNERKWGKFPSQTWENPVLTFTPAYLLSMH